MLKKISSTALALLTAFSMLTPAFALAHGNDQGNSRNNSKNEFRLSGSATNEFGVRVFDGSKENKNDDNNRDNNNRDKEKNDKRDRDDHGMKVGGFLPSLFYSGKVTSVSGDSFVIETKNNQSFTVQTSSAKIIQIPRTVISTSDIAVGDSVNVTGTKSGVMITASVVYSLSQNLKPAMAKGTVTAKTADTLIVQSSIEGTAPFTVNVDGDTKVMNSDHTEATLADINTESEVKVVGFWDNVLNVFNAIKIKLF